MNFNFAKYFIIVALTASAIYLAGQLWFDIISNRNFFYSFLSAFSYSTPVDYVEPDSVISPYRVITNAGSSDNKKFTLMYTDLDKRSIVNACDDALAEAIKRGDYVGSYILNWNELLNNRIICYDYKLSMPTEIFADSFGQKSGTLTSKFKEFNMIAILPGRGVVDKTHVIFIDEPEAVCYEFTVASDIPAAEFMNDSHSVSPTESLPYISSMQSGIDKFESNVFIPQLPANGLLYSTAVIENPYSAKGDLLISDVEEKVKFFFGNLTAKHSLTMDNAYVFSDENTVVKYYTNDTLEYSDYRSGNKIIGPTLVSDYYAAVKFISNDTAVVNEFYLENYERGSDQNVFYFNYKFNNMPVILPKEYRNEIGMDYAIEVTVLNKKVINYKKMAYNFMLDEEAKETADAGYTDVLDSMASAGAFEGLRLSDLEFGYKMEQSKTLLLNWFLKIGEIESVSSAQRRN